LPEREGKNTEPKASDFSSLFKRSTLPSNCHCQPFRFKARDAIERIKDAEKANELCDIVPFNQHRGMAEQIRQNNSELYLGAPNYRLATNAVDNITDMLAKSIEERSRRKRCTSQQKEFFDPNANG
jgi:hypothetical protein